MNARINPNMTYRSWGWPLAIGIILMIIGVIAIATPYIATLASMLVLGWLLIIGGVAEIVYAFITRHLSSFVLNVLLGLFSIVIGVLIIAFPQATAMTITVLLAAFFLALGLFRIFTALALRFENWGWVLAGGVLAFILGILILIHWPSSAFWVIGLFVGIDFLFLGWSYVLLSTFLKRTTVKPKELK
jgi:uncharacterized membrane protein HdeD (DUF308 family)